MPWVSCWWSGRGMATRWPPSARAVIGPLALSCHCTAPKWSQVGWHKGLAEGMALLIPCPRLTLGYVCNCFGNSPAVHTTALPHRGLGLGCEWGRPYWLIEGSSQRTTWLDILTTIFKVQLLLPFFSVAIPSQNFQPLACWGCQQVWGCFQPHKSSNPVIGGHNNKERLVGSALHNIPLWYDFLSTWVTVQEVAIAILGKKKHTCKEWIPLPLVSSLKDTVDVES